MARRLLAQTIAPRDLTSWAYRYISYDGTPLAAELIALDNAYDVVEAVHDWQPYTSTETRDIDVDVLSEARRLLRDTTTAEKD